MDSYPDPSAIESWPAAVVAVVVILAVAVIPSLFAYLNARLTREVREQAAAIKRSVTEKNGGSSMVDRFDALDSKLDDHLAWSEGIVEQMTERFSALEDHKDEESSNGS